MKVLSLIHHEPMGLRDIIDFGKYEGYKLGQIAEEDPTYLEECLKSGLRLRPSARREVDKLINVYNLKHS